MLAPTARDCVRTAHVLYGDILTVIEHADFDPLAARAKVGIMRRLRVGASGYAGAVRARR
jgi:phytoene synthase